MNMVLVVVVDVCYGEGVVCPFVVDSSSPIELFG